MVAMATRPPGRRSRGASQTQITTVMLGCVDGFNQYQRACKADDGRVADVGLLAAHGDAFEAFELADRLFDAGA